MNPEQYQPTPPFMAQPAKQKSKTPLFVTGAIFAGVLLLAGGALIGKFVLPSQPVKQQVKTDIVSKKIKKEEQKKQEVTETISTGTAQANAAFGSEEEVKALISDLREVAKKHVSQRIEFYKVYDTYSPIFKPNNSLAPVLLDKSFGLNAEVNAASSSSSELFNLIGSLYGVFDAELKKRGFTDYEDGGMFTKAYLNKKQNITCSVLDNVLSSFSFNCAHTSWVSAQKINFTNQLAKARSDNRSLLNASEDLVKNSTNAPYQYVQASTAGGYELFYRKNANSEWKYVTGGNGAAECKKFDSDAKKAFAGFSCVNENGSVLNL